METKKCTKCGEVKEISEFHKNKAGRRSHCKSCCKEYKKANADKIKEYYKEYKKEYKKANADVVALRNIQDRSRRKGIPFDLELEDIQGVTHCPVFGWELKRNSGGAGVAHPNSPSVDRRIPELGYVKGNIQILSNKANKMKQDATPEELLMFADWIIKTYRK